MNLSFEGKLGEGSYGEVYKASEVLKDGMIKCYAIKRNFKDETATLGIGNVRELGNLAELKGNPLVVNLIYVSYGDPFPKSCPMPVTEARNNMNEDRIHFVLEYMELSGDKLFKDKKQCTPQIAKELTYQLLLAIEYIHAKGITHRDLKPANLLVTLEPGKEPLLKVCDFGMSVFLNPRIPSTPGVSTSWYRAPEICCGSTSYDQSVDLWSAGCIIYEMFAKDALLAGTLDDSKAAFNKLLGQLSATPSEEDLSSIQEHLETKMILDPSIASPLLRRSYAEHINLNKEELKNFNETPGTMSQLVEVITGLLKVNPAKRWTATQALDHKFFDHYRDCIEKFRKAYPPIPPSLPVIKIIECKERYWACTIAIYIYNNREKFVWYQDRLIFRAIDLFDRYLEWAFTDGNCQLMTAETQKVGRLHDRPNTEIRFWTCLYLIHKYIITMHFPVEWKTFAPSIYGTPDIMKLAENFELGLLKDILKYKVYRHTLLEISDEFGKTYDDDFVADLLRKYTRITSWNDGSVRALYRNLMGINKS